MFRWFRKSPNQSNHIFRSIVSSTILTAGIAILQIAQPQQAAFASSMTQVSPVIQSSLTPSQDPAKFSQEKQQFADEYIGMLHGKESLTQYENHYLVFMKKWNLGATQNLHKALTMTRSQMVAARAQKAAVSPDCPSIASATSILHSNVTGASVNPNCVTPPNPVSAVQFPEEFPTYCGQATISTALVEDSFAWPNANSYTNPMGSTDTIGYNPYQVSQPQNTATWDEDMLAGKVQYGLLNLAPRDSNTNPNDLAAGTDPGPMLYVMNLYVNGKGGAYATETNMSKFQNYLISDANQGWDLTVGMTIPAYTTPVLPGWPVANHARPHWVTGSYYSNGGATTEIADPVANSSVYFQNNGYNTTGIPPHENITTSVLLSQSWVFIW